MSAKSLGLAFTLMCLVAHSQADCHVHAPDDYPHFGSRPLVIPLAGNRDACQSLNQEQFGGRGRCHCADGLSLQPAAPRPGSVRRGSETEGNLPYLP